MRQAEYIWLDGAVPTQEVRSKTRVVNVVEGQSLDPDAYPEWGFDGSSTYQASGSYSDLVPVPVRVLADPIRGDGARLVLCEVMNPDDTPHESNTRSGLRLLLDQEAREEEPWVGFEQEYTLFQGNRPLGFPVDGEPAAQGPFYCGVGSRNICGRDVVEAHTLACMEAGILIYGINAEVMPGQWEFQIGYRGVDGESPDVLNVSDQLIVARWLLHRLSERFGVRVSLDPKPAKGDWNGAGNHTNFSTVSMRDRATGMHAINDAIDRLSRRHERHIAGYGHGLDERLTRLHETCSIHEFRSGIADRGASIRVPRAVADRGFGYLEDRRPGANCDPYRVRTLLLETICTEAGVEEITSAV